MVNTYLGLSVFIRKPCGPMGFPKLVGHFPEYWPSFYILNAGFEKLVPSIIGKSP